MNVFMKSILCGAALIGSSTMSLACTGISLTAKDGSYVQARTIEWAYGAVLKSEYVVIPRGERLRSYTPSGDDGLQFSAKYGVVGLSVEVKEFIAEGINEAGLSAGLFFFPGYGGYEPFDATRSDVTLADMQVVQWMLTQFASIDELIASIDGVRIVALVDSAVLHWRIGEQSGRQVVMEIVDGKPRFYENRVGVLTNAPGFEWHVTNLNNYVSLRPGSADSYQLGDVTLKPLGGGSAMHGLPGDFTSPSRFVRAAFFRNTAHQQADGHSTVLQCFHILNNFDVPMAVENPQNTALCSATQWTSAIDLKSLKVYYRTQANNSIRCIDLGTIDFERVAYQAHLLDSEPVQPIEYITIG